MIIMLIGYVFSFLIIGLWLALKAQKKKLIPKEFLFIGALASSLLFCYTIFYLYLYNPQYAHNFIILLIFSSPLLFLSIAFDYYKSSEKRKLIGRYYLPPFIITSVLLAIFSSLFYSCHANEPSLGGYREVNNKTFCHIEALPFDNALPFIYAENILNNEDKKLALDWTIADRPPLQIAATLPIEDLSKGNDQFSRFYAYHIFSVLLQLAWVGAIWGVLQRLKINKKKQVLILIGFSATGFFYLHSIFIWPKLLSAALVVSAIAIFVGAPSKKIPYNYLPFAAVLIALGLLAHSGVLFTLVAFALLFLYMAVRAGNINYKCLLVSAFLGLAILAPWQNFKNSVVHSDRLVKYHFAGIHEYEDKRGTLKTIVDEYRKTDFARWQHVKVQNSKTLISGNLNQNKNCPIKADTIFSGCNLSYWRAVTFFSTLFALEIFILGLVLFFYRLIRRQLDDFDKQIGLIALGSIVLWVLAMFEPGGTVLHQGSYATMLFIFILCAKQLAKLPIPALVSITGLQLIIFYLAWVSAFSIL